MMEATLAVRGVMLVDSDILPIHPKKNTVRR